MPGNPPQIFIAHANEDKPLVRELYGKLVEAGYKPWLDEEDLLPGQNWREEIPKALKNSDLFIACLSSTSISKRGYIQREFKMAMEMLAELPPGEIYLIPLKFDDCTIPELRQSEYGLNLRDIQWLDYWKLNGFDKLVKAIGYQFGSQGTDQPDTATGQGASQPSIEQEHREGGDNVGGNKTVNNYYYTSESQASKANVSGYRHSYNSKKIKSNQSELQNRKLKKVTKSFIKIEIKRLIGSLKIAIFAIFVPTFYLILTDLDYAYPLILFISLVGITSSVLYSQGIKYDLLKEYEVPFGTIFGLIIALVFNILIKLPFRFFELFEKIPFNIKGYLLIGAVIGAFVGKIMKGEYLNHLFLSDIKLRHKSIQKLQANEEILWSDKVYYSIRITDWGMLYLSSFSVRIKLVLLLTNKRLLLLLERNGKGFDKELNEKVLRDINRYPISIPYPKIADIKVSQPTRKNLEIEIRTIYGDDYILTMEETSKQSVEELLSLTIREFDDSKNQLNRAFTTLSLRQASQSSSERDIKEQTEPSTQGTTIYGFAPGSTGSNVVSGQNVQGNTIIGTQNNYGTSSPPPGVGNGDSLELWTEKLAAYRREEAIAADPEKKFQLKVLIKECLGKIEELGG